MFQDYIIVSYGPFSARKSTLSHARTSAGRQEGPSTGAQICTDGFSKRERASERERDAHYPYTILYILIYLCIYICTDVYPNLNLLFHVEPLLILLGESSPLESG
jgi:hypothetical protein